MRKWAMLALRSLILSFLGIRTYCMKAQLRPRIALKKISNPKRHGYRCEHSRLIPTPKHFDLIICEASTAWLFAGLWNSRRSRRLLRDVLNRPRPGANS